MQVSEILWNPGYEPKVWSVNVNKHTDSYIFAQSEGFKKDIETNLKLCGDFPDVKTRIGIEIECENMYPGNNGDAGIDSLARAAYFPASCWKIKLDGSLRNGGLEFISPAMIPKQTAANLALLYTWLKRYNKDPKVFLPDGNGKQIQPDFSWRTSIHVHLECIQMDVHDFKKLLLLYFLFEESLFQFVDPERREHNIFCTPITRTFFYPFYEFINNSTTEKLANSYRDMVNHIKKYSAVNFEHMYDFGTLEFRHLKGTDDLKFLSTWIKLLLKLYQSAKTLSMETIVNNIMCLNTNSMYGAFVELVFGEELAESLLPVLGNHLMSKGVSLTKEIISGNILLNSIKFSKDSGLAQFCELEERKSKRDKLSTKPKKQVVATGQF